MFGNPGTCCWDSCWEPCWEPEILRKGAPSSVAILAQALAQALGSRRIGSRVTATDSDSVLLEGVGVSSQLKLADLIGRELL